MVAFSKSNRRGAGLPALSLALLALSSLVSAQMFADLNHGHGRNKARNNYMRDDDEPRSAVDQLDQNSSVWDLLAAH